MIKVSKRTYQKLKEELEEAQAQLLKFKQEAARTTSSANLIDKADMVVEEQAMNKRIGRLEKLYEECLPIDDPKHVKYVVIGHKVTLFNDGTVFSNSAKKITKIVDGIALDSSMISAWSPFGKKLLGKKIGDWIGGLEIINIQ